MDLGDMQTVMRWVVNVIGWSWVIFAFGLNIALIYGLVSGFLTMSAHGQEAQMFLEPPPFFHHPVTNANMPDPYNGKCRRKDGADCCGAIHCYPVPADDLGRLQLQEGGEWVDPYTMFPRPSICDSSVLPPGYNWLDHVCTQTGMGVSITCIFLKGQSS